MSAHRNVSSGEIDGTEYSPLQYTRQQMERSAEHLENYAMRQHTPKEANNQEKGQPRLKLDRLVVHMWFRWVCMVEGCIIIEAKHFEILTGCSKDLAE